MRRLGDALESDIFPKLHLSVADLFAGVLKPEIALVGLGPFALPNRSQ